MGAKEMPLRLQKYIVKKSTLHPPDPSPVKPQEMEVILLPEKSVNDKRPVVLFVMQKYGFGPTEKTFCGIGLRGKLTSDILQFSTKYNFIRCHIDNIKSLTLYINKFTPKIIIYNYHSNTTRWLDVSLTTIFPNMIHIFIHYDLTQPIVDSTKTNETFYG